MVAEKTKPKVVILLGPTASGKTDWSLRLAKKFNGEIISADSRQIYRKMDIGTAKELGEWRRKGLRRTYYISDIPHHLVDFLDPGKFFTVAEFCDQAGHIIRAADKAGHLPIVAGGTGLYIYALVNNLQIPRVSPNRKLRRSLEAKSNEELMKLLQSLDATTAASVDSANKRRIIRALEVCILSGVPFSSQQKKGEPIFSFLQIGIDVPREILYERINKRVDEMMKRGLLKEVEDLTKQKYDWSLPSMSGIGYRQFQKYFSKENSLDQVIEELKRDTRRYAKRQLTWFKRDQSIQWCQDYETAEKVVNDFLNH
ncbi:MAG TPA: tRNA (adenosine(37)-N6)-dimethylallyltransferase MiaA [Patescibacteria group bacterium]|nr:tRNA (adenosine(37)-N6)-dimethylallyltransferase MiaA [Patescibacteria group bacterium]